MQPPRIADLRDVDTKTKVHRAIWTLGCYPLRIALVTLGVMILFFAAYSHAYAYVNVSASTQTLQMQPGSALPIDVFVQIQGDPVSVFFTPQAHPFLTLDGQLQSITAPYSFTRHASMYVNPQTPPGNYSTTLYVQAQANGATYSYPLTFFVEVSPKGLAEFHTTPNSTISPYITNPIVSTRNVVLNRDQEAHVTISFTNNGSATDYRVELAENVPGLLAYMQDGAHSFVQPGETVYSVLQIKASTTTPIGEYSIPLRIRDVVTQDKTSLGFVHVRVEKTEGAQLVLPQTSFEVSTENENTVLLTIQNTEWSDLDAHLITSSPRVFIENTQVHIPAKSTIEVPVIILPSDAKGTRVETLYLVSPTFETQVSFEVNTVLEDTNASASPAPGLDSFTTGLASFITAPILVVIFFLAAAATLFSSRFRKLIWEKILRQKPIEVTVKGTKIEREIKQQSIRPQFEEARASPKHEEAKTPGEPSPKNQ